MKKLSKFMDKKIKLNKKQQFRILEFFLNTSVPRMLSNRERDSK